MPEKPYSRRSLIDAESPLCVRSDPWPEKGWPVPPAALRHNRLAWWAACHIMKAVEIQLSADIETQDAVAILGALPRTGQTPDLAGAWAEYTKRWGLKRVVLPAGYFHRGKLTWLHREGAVPGGPRVYIYHGFSLPLAMWLLLSEPEVCRRVRQCPECATFVLDATRNLCRRFCSWPCAHRAASRAYRAREKKEWTQTNRVSSLPRNFTRG
jgi:hypothetical protein